MHRARDRVVEYCQNWADSLDRTSIGRFANKSEYLALADALSIVNEVNSGYYSIPVADLSDIGLYFRDAEQRRFVTRGFMSEIHKVLTELVESDGVDIVLVQAELHHWTYRTSLGAVISVDDEDDDRFDLWVSRFKRIGSLSPAFHDYFAVDIWDEDLISRCIQEGIDPELARTLA